MNESGREAATSIFRRETDMDHDLPDVGTVEFAVIDDLRIRYARSGVNQGVPVLLTSPWPESIYAFRDVLPVLGC